MNEELGWEGGVKEGLEGRCEGVDEFGTAYQLTVVVFYTLDTSGLTR